MIGDARFWSKVDKTGDCWIWTAQRVNGYGRFQVATKRSALAHRVAYEMANGPVPAGLALDHLCRNRACVRPSHLEAVTARENTLRGKTIPAAHVSKTHCPQGHRYSADNTYVYGRRRNCRVCTNARSRRYRERQVA